MNDRPAPPIAILGVPFDNVTTVETVALIEMMVASGRPHYLVTANVDFLVQALRDIELRRILFEAHLVLCDGTPLLWASTLLGNRLPERVAGSDLVPLLIQIAARKHYRIFFLGGSSETVELATARLQAQYPELKIAGHYSPPFTNLLEMDHEEIKRRIRAAQPDLLFVSFGCPKQEKWMAMHYAHLNIPVSVGVGGTIDFLAGRLARAPIWMQRFGLEWTFRLAQEPRRLLKRYIRDLWCFGWGLLGQWWHLQVRFRRAHDSPLPPPIHVDDDWQQLQAPARFDRSAVESNSLQWENLLANHRLCLVDLSRVQCIDSTGVAFLIQLQKRARIAGRSFVLLSPSPAVCRALHEMRLDSFFDFATDIEQAKSFRVPPEPVAPAMLQPNGLPRKQILAWQGDVTAANAEQVWTLTERYIQCQAVWQKELSIDLTRLRFIDSSGACLMIRAKRAAFQAGINLKFAAANGDVRNVLRLSRLEDYLLH